MLFGIGMSVFVCLAVFGNVSSHHWTATLASVAGVVAIGLSFWTALTAKRRDPEPGNRAIKWMLVAVIVLMFTLAYIKRNHV